MSSIFIHIHHFIHIIAQEKFTPQYARDLLHHLLEWKKGDRILKLNPGDNPEDIISALKILTAVFDNLKDSQDFNT